MNSCDAETLKKIEEVQKAVEQMKLDDLEESPNFAHEEFQCHCCGESRELAGSVTYGSNLFCNECVLLVEVSLMLGKIKHPEEILEKMEDRRFQNLYESIFQREESLGESQD